MKVNTLRLDYDPDTQEAGINADFTDVSESDMRNLQAVVRLAFASASGDTPPPQTGMPRELPRTKCSFGEPTWLSRGSRLLVDFANGSFAVFAIEDDRIVHAAFRLCDWSEDDLILNGTFTQEEIDSMKSKISEAKQRDESLKAMQAREAEHKEYLRLKAIYGDKNP